MRPPLVTSLLAGAGLALAGLALAAPLLAEPAASHRAAAAELMRVMEIREQATGAVEKVLDLQLAQNPELRPQREIILDWLRSVVGSQEAVDRLAALYVERFSEVELRALIDFYSTPVGQRAVREIPVLMEQGMLIGQELAQEHSGELRRKLEEHAAAQQGGDAAVAKVRESAKDREAASSTLAAMRNVGTAMMAWGTDAIATLPVAPAESPAGDSGRIDWSRCPRISYDELHAVLVDAYIEEIPRQDGWGHDLEFCLQRATVPQSYFAGIRSPGRDGRFDGVGYSNGPFPHGEPDHDVVWMDGLFVAWPGR